MKNLQSDTLLTAPSQEAQVTKSKRPFGLKVISILMLIQGGLVTFALGASLFAIAQGLVPESTIANLPSNIALGIAGAEAILTICAGFGLWGKHRWAWYLTMLLLAYGMTMDIWQYLNDDPEYFSMLLNVIMVFYLNLREVQNVFPTGKNGASV